MPSHPYAYIKKHYGLDVTPGETVIAMGRRGVVQSPLGRAIHYVYIRFENVKQGDGHPFHPNSISKLGEDVTGSATIVAPGEKPSQDGLATQLGRIIADSLTPRTYEVVAEDQGDGWWFVRCDEFQGCHTQAEGLDAAIEGICRVIEMCLEEEGETQDVSKDQISIDYGSSVADIEQRCCDLISNAPPAEPPTLEEMVAAVEELENQIATYQPPSVRRVVVLKGAPIDVVPLGDTLYMSEGAFQHLKKEGLKAFAPSVGDLTGIPVVDGTKGEDL